jgi:hypothetical protein
LDTQTTENGVLQYVPGLFHFSRNIQKKKKKKKKEKKIFFFRSGSHRWPLLPVTSRHFSDMMSIKTVLSTSELCDFEHRRAALLTKGFCSFHHALTCHG